MGDSVDARTSNGSSTGSTDRWPAWLCAAFRFSFVYLALFCLPIPGQTSVLNIVPHAGNEMERAVRQRLEGVAVWVGRHVVHLEGRAATWHGGGSGDTALHYVLYGCMAAAAMLGTIIWTLLDRRRPHYRTAFAWLHLLLRFTLAAAMLEYGFSKIFPRQFGQPGLEVLTQTYGDSTPMRLLWTFMGSSAIYRVACGVGEVVGGVLLMFRRTSMLGALLTAAIMFNVMLMNFGYDVPVKLYSTHLFLASVFLLLPDAHALYRFFVLRQPAAPSGWPPPPRPGALIWASRIACSLVLIGALLSFGVGTWESTARPRPQRSELYGLWQIDTPVDPGPEPQWHCVYIEDRSGFTLVGSDQTQTWFSTTYAPVSNTIELRGNHSAGVIEWHRTDPAHVTFTGTLDGRPLKLALRRVSPETYVLQTHRFHFVNEDRTDR